MASNHSIEAIMNVTMENLKAMVDADTIIGTPINIGEVTLIPVSKVSFGLATGGSWLCYYKALQDGPASVVVPIDKLSILVTILFSYIVFHEKLSKKAFLGLVLTVGGTLLMLAK